MRRRRGSMILIVGVLITLVVIVSVVRMSLDAEGRIFTMVKDRKVVYEQAAHQLLEDGEVLDIEDIESIYVFTGEHNMVEFIVDGDGLIPPAQYYGFYYSPDDVPLPFQNVKVPLTEYKENEWEWTEEGDNHGITKKITDCWYYFEAWL